MKFEDNLKKLEELVGKMESGEMNLDEMIKAFEDGRKLVTECQKDLPSANASRRSPRRAPSNPCRSEVLPTTIYKLPTFYEADFRPGAGRSH